MAIYDLPILGPTILPDANVFMDRVGNQVAATNEYGNQLSFVMTDGAADRGIYGSFSVPQNYAGTPVLVIRGILDGAPGAADVLGFGIKGMTKSDNEALDVAYSSEDIASATIGSGGTNHSDEDLYEETIALSNFTGFAVGDTAFFFFFIDISATTYAGNFLLTDLLFRYADA
jgi:hypothetical protein